RAPARARGRAARGRRRARRRAVPDVARRRRRVAPAVSAMAAGSWALVLHAHLPFVRHPEDPTVMEEQWLYEAITGTYLPLLQVFEGLIGDHIPYRCTVS